MKLKKLAIAMAVAMSFGHAAADPVAESVIALTGDYIKIGVSDYGTIGSKGNTSPGILYDNTGTRTFNTSYDYLTPGAPFEGFTVQYGASGITSTHTNNNMSGGPITGSLYNYSGIAYRGTTFDNRAVWLGTHSDFDLINDVRFNNTQKFVDISSILTAKTNMTDLYFARFIDPDARAADGDSSATTNTLGYDPIPTTNVVFSEALASKYALGLYTGQVGSVGTGISSSWSTDPITYYSGTNDGTGDYTIGIAFYVPTLNTGEIATFNYAYIFGPSTLAAGATAVSSGAGGGEAGVVPGCVTNCGMEGVDPVVPVVPVDPVVPPAPTIVSTDTDYVTGTLSVYNRQPGGKTLTIKNTATNSSLPVYTDNYSDGSEVVRFGTETQTQAITNYSTRVDQYDYLGKANQRMNLGLDSDVLSRHKGNESTLQTKTTLAGTEEKGWTYVIAEGARSNTSDTYSMNTQRYGVGHEKKIESNWIVGAQYNYVHGRLSGQDAGGSLTKNHVGAYSLYNHNGWLLKSDVGVAVNNYRNNHSLNNIAELGPLSNSGSASGTDVWVSNRLYTPDTNGFRPYAGVRVEKNSRGAVTETGSALTAMSYNGVNTTKTIGEAGIRYEAEINDTVNVLAEAGRTTNDITSMKVGASFTPEKNILGTITVGQQRQNGVVNTIAQAMLKWMF
jgi:hypothetical protein